jgi:hypothetical protein
MWFYFAIFFLISFFCFVNFKQKREIIIIMTILLVIVAAFRGAIDRDHKIYIAMYQASLSGTNYNEFSYNILSLIIYYLSDNIIFIFIFYAILGVSIKINAIKKLTDFPICAILIYFSMYYILHEMTQIRVGLATGFILLSIPYIYEKDFKRFLLYVLLGFFFHYSVIIVLPFYFLSHNKISKWFYILIPLAYILYFLDLNISSLLELIKLDLIAFKYKAYKTLSAIDRINIFNFIMIMRYIFIIFLLWKWEFLYEKNKYSVIIIKLYIISCFFLIILADIPAIAFRVSEIFAVVEIIIIPYFVYFFKNENQGALLVTAIGMVLIYISIIQEKLLLPYF